MHDKTSNSADIELSGQASVLEMTPTEVRLDREKLILEREKLTLERERMAAEREQWKREREWRDKAPTGMHVGAGILGLAVLVALLLGGFLGYNSGYESGASQVPEPKKVLVGHQFLRMLSRTVYAPRAADRGVVKAPGLDLESLYKRPPDTHAFGNLIILR
jgi:hypothetical protein